MDGHSGLSIGRSCSAPKWRLLVDDCTVKLSNQARDNFVRSNNCGLGIEEAEAAQNIHIVGLKCKVRGEPTIPLHGRRQQAPERQVVRDGWGQGRSLPVRKLANIGILMAYVNRFSVRNIAMFDSHCWEYHSSIARTGQSPNPLRINLEKADRWRAEDILEPGWNRFATGLPEHPYREHNRISQGTT